jgi:hypothetical protein
MKNTITQAMIDIRAHLTEAYAPILGPVAERVRATHRARMDALELAAMHDVERRQRQARERACRAPSAISRELSRVWGLARVSRADAYLAGCALRAARQAEIARQAETARISAAAAAAAARPVRRARKP